MSIFTNTAGRLEDSHLLHLLADINNNLLYQTKS